MKALVGAFNQEQALVGAFSVITNLRMELRLIPYYLWRQQPLQLGVGPPPLGVLLVVAGPVHRAELRVLHARGRRARARVRDLGALQRKLRQREPALVLVKLERVPVRIDNTLKIYNCIYTFLLCRLWIKPKLLRCLQSCQCLDALLRGNSVGLFKPLASKRRSSLLNENSLLEKIVLKFLSLPDVIQSRIGCLGNVRCSVTSLTRYLSSH